MGLAIPHLPATGAITAFFQAVMIDLALAGDNAVAIGLSARPASLSSPCT
jgi:predicted tellurium resistance membrane protein TerC